MAWTIGLLIYVVVQFVAFLFVLVATPIDMFRIRPRFTFAPNQCLTLWGIKNNCSTTVYDIRSDSRWATCTPRRDRFRVAQAFAVISIFVYGAAFVLGVIMLFCCRWFRWVCLALNSVGAVTVCIVWACMAVSYNRDEGTGCQELRIVYSYGAGFVLLLLAWVLDILNIPVLLFLCQDSDSGENGNEAESKSQE
ncbi:Amastin surface glycoprotein, putative [Leishmania lindenbergi]|uniref:Amastin surface glycoprotein n=1 Tax=Leishmania lindenbergi TaxID=651832 RepID=A0AAW3AZS3_9TRYP